MTVKGHVVLSVPIAMVSMIALEKFYFKANIDQLSFLLYYAFVIFGSILPDIDEPESYIGRRLPVFSNLLSIFVKHRGITHFLCVPLFVFVIAHFTEDSYMKISLIGLSIGIFAHTLGDMLTKGGIPGFFFPFFPTKRAVLLPRFLRFYTNSIAEHLVVAVIFMCTVLSIFTIKDLLIS